MYAVGISAKHQNPSFKIRRPISDGFQVFDKLESSQIKPLHQAIHLFQNMTVKFNYQYDLVLFDYIYYLEFQVLVEDICIWIQLVTPIPCNTFPFPKMYSSTTLK